MKKRLLALMAKKDELKRQAYAIADKAIAENSADKEEVVKAAVKKIDQMACKGIIHKNNAARKKSSLVIRLAKAN